MKNNKDRSPENIAVDDRVLPLRMLNHEIEMFQTRMDLNQNQNEEMIGILNAQLANILDLFCMMKHAHWNVRGPQFMALYKLFDEIAAGLLTYVDKIGERIATQGGMALGILRIASETSQLEPYPLTIVDGLDMPLALANRMAQVLANIRSAARRAESLQDMNTYDLLIETSRDLDKWLWLLESHVPF